MLDIDLFKENLERINILSGRYLQDKKQIEICRADLLVYKERPSVYAALEQDIECLKNELLTYEDELKELKKYVYDNQAKVGNEIILYLRLLNEEANVYLTGDKAFHLLKLTVVEIKNCIAEIDSLMPLIQAMHEEKSEVSQNLKETITEQYSPGEVQILGPEHEFGGYILYKAGSCLKSFFEDRADQIKKVLLHYNYNYEDALYYLKTKHGLCAGQTVDLNTFKQLCIKHFGLGIRKKEKPLVLVLNGQKIEGEDNTSVFINCLFAIGFNAIIKHCSFIFGSTLDISKKPIFPSMRSSHRQIEQDGHIFTISVCSVDSVKIRQLSDIKKTLNLDLAIN